MNAINILNIGPLLPCKKISIQLNKTMEIQNNFDFFVCKERANRSGQEKTLMKDRSIYHTLFWLIRIFFLG
ncbi:hypothetical protein SEEH1584_03733 [Salmonella enterica subsp. enterica serovar Heidelberg str. 41584]|nr:hypothetical protein SEEH1584_03733 [Salmonella enterica subsp. enterica serovar Heidelberg str. 41584]